MVQVARGKALVAKLRANPDVRDAEALAAYLGRKKKLRQAAKKVKKLIKKPGEFTTTTEAEEWGRKHYPHMEWDLEGMDVKLANSNLGQFKKLADDFPEVADRMTAIKMGDAPEGKNWWAFASQGKKGPGSITFVRDHYKDHDAFAKSVAHSADVGFHPKGAKDPASVMTHEFGHQVDYYLSSLNDTSVLPFVRSGGEGLVSDTFRTWRQNNWADGKRISGYAKYNNKEGWAEGFTALYHSPTAGRIKYVKNMKSLLDALSPKNHRKPGDFKWTFDLRGSEKEAASSKVFKWYEQFNLFPSR